jgi:hypothetical protein
MQIVVNEPDRLMLSSRSRLFGAVFVIGALMWLVLVAGAAVQGAIEVSRQQPLPSLYWVRMLGLLIFFVFGVVLAWVVGQTAVQVLQGTTCTFDRLAETVTVRRAGWPRQPPQQMSIYGVSHAHIEHNLELKTLAVLLVLRSGERIPLGVLQAFEQSQAEAILQAVKAFLRGH